LEYPNVWLMPEIKKIQAIICEEVKLKFRELPVNSKYLALYFHWITSNMILILTYSESMFSYLEHELSIPSKSNAERSYQVDGLHKKKSNF
jgi:hypothetical protein